MIKQITPENEKISLADIDLTKDSKILINTIRRTNIYNIVGDKNMIGSRNVGDITGSTFGANTNFQGDDIKQVNIQNNNELSGALKELVKEIDEIEDDAEKDNANMHYEMLVKSIEENKSSRIKNCIDALVGIIGTAASIITIANQFGIVL